MSESSAINGNHYEQLHQGRTKMYKSKVAVVLGAQWGDEGKGKVVDMLASDVDIVCRCQVRKKAKKCPRLISDKRRGNQCLGLVSLGQGHPAKQTGADPSICVFHQRRVIFFTTTIIALFGRRMLGRLPICIYQFWARHVAASVFRPWAVCPSVRASGACVGQPSSILVLSQPRSRLTCVCVYAVELAAWRIYGQIWSPRKIGGVLYYITSMISFLLMF